MFSPRKSTVFLRECLPLLEQSNYKTITTMTTNADSLHDLLEALAAGNQSVDSVRETITSMISPQTAANANGSVRIDLQRQDRCGYPEVIYAPGKTDEALQAAFQTLLTAGQNCLATRCSIEQGTFLNAAYPESIYDEQARTVRINKIEKSNGRVVVVTAGTSDRPVGLEALETLRWMNVDAGLLMDVGVAGPQRFLNEKHQLDNCDAVVVVAGMEGALPSVVAGWLSCPVIAVPTSVGYGAAFGGVAALLGMLNSCAANVAVVNIDAGFKAGYLAGMIAQGQYEK